MNGWSKFEIIPLSKKMREKVKQHGKVWWVRAKTDDEIRLSPDKRWSLRTLGAVHAGGYPYELWALPGKDFNFGLKVG
jgi:hypothetical protein